MKCPFCKEEIQTDAIICRFCNAERVNDEWVRSKGDTSSANSGHRKGAFTIRTAAVFFFLSAVFEVFNLGSEITLIGRLFGGGFAIVYHLSYGALFGAMGAGLWCGRPLGLKVMFSGTLIYTIEEGMYLLDTEGRLAELTRITDQFGGMPEVIGNETILGMTTVATLLILCCWWGFLGYLYVRRDYFNLPVNVRKEG